MDNAQQQIILEQLIPIYGRAGFDQFFEKLTKGESNNTRFLLKMELKRLSTPSLRRLDLRAKVEGECQEYDYNGITHFLDASAIQQFKQLVTTHNGTYTTGVYEAMQEYESELKIKRVELRNKGQSNIPTEFPVNAIQFGHYHGRTEERMHLSLPIKVILPNGEAIEAMSSNMSISGIRIKMPDELPFTRGEHLIVYFTGLEKEYVNAAFSQGTNYEVMGIEKKEQGQWLRLRIINPDKSQLVVFQRFLNSYRGRYRVDVSHLYRAIITKGHEQFFLPRTCSIPLYFFGQQSPSLKFILCNENNQEQLAYWRNEQEQLLLGQLFHAPRMSRLMQQPHGQCLIFSFHFISSNRLFFYSATSDELSQQPELKRLFFSYGAHRPSWRISQFHWNQAVIQSEFLTTLLPDEQDNYDLVQLQRELNDLSFIGLLTDITDESSNTFYQKLFHSDKDPNELAKFGQYRYPIPPVTEVQHKYVRMRRNERFQHRSIVEVTVNNKTSLGWMVDFSIGGMKVELEESLPVLVNDIIEITLPQFQKLGPNFKLKMLPYRVANSNSQITVLNLQSNGSGHHGDAFFKQLIKSNADKLKAIPDIPPLKGLSDALRNIYCHQLFKCVLFVNRQGTRLNLSTLAYGAQPMPMENYLKLNRQEQTAELTDLFREGRFHDCIQLPLKDLAPSDKPYQIRLFLAIHSVSGKVIAVRRQEQFENDEDLLFFVKQAHQNGGLICLELRGSRVGRPDTQYIQKEMKYISQYATHKAKQLEEELWSILSVIEIEDVTQEWLTLLEE